METVDRTVLTFHWLKVENEIFVLGKIFNLE